MSRVDELRGSPLSVGTLEELIDDQHAIVSSSIGPEYYVNILSFVDKDLLEPGCSVLLHNKVRQTMQKTYHLQRRLFLFFSPLIYIYICIYIICIYLYHICIYIYISLSICLFLSITSALHSEVSAWFCCCE